MASVIVCMKFARTEANAENKAMTFIMYIPFKEWLSMYFPFDLSGLSEELLSQYLDKKLWWSCYFLARIVSTRGGLGTAVRNKNCLLSVDSHLYLFFVIKLNPPPHNKSNTVVPYFGHLLTLYSICTHVLTFSIAIYIYLSCKCL